MRKKGDVPGLERFLEDFVSGPTVRKKGVRVRKWVIGSMITEEDILNLPPVELYQAVSQISSREFPVFEKGLVHFMFCKTIFKHRYLLEKGNQVVQSDATFIQGLQHAFQSIRKRAFKVVMVSI